MLDRCGMLLVFYYFMYFCDYEVGMKRKGLYKIVNGFRVVGIVAGAIWAVINIIKELASIPWNEWAESGVWERMGKFVETIILLLCWLFILWILHRLLMFMFHKMWPETFDEYGHMRKFINR